MFDVNHCVSFLTDKGGKNLSESMNRFFERAGSSIHRVAWTALHFIQQEPGITQKELAARLIISEPTMADLANRMIRDGLIIREMDPANKKYRHLYLTEYGTKEYQKLLRIVELFNTAAIEGIPEKDLEIFWKVMGKMIENVNRDKDDEET
ncbi:MAG: winged helix-turn-helix transcriptional regulator [Lachnospiraceae bacterium]|nr:winged helix-turn-helix transcriptional regulator [Lachnospiraceae bacterium]